MLLRGGFNGGTAKGRLGNSVYQANPYGQLVRNGPSPVNPNSPGQVMVRYGMSLCSQLWSQTLTPEERQGWADYAAATPLPDKFGTSQIVSGRNMFIRSGILALLGGTNVRATAPTTPGIGTQVGLTFVLDASSGLSLTSIDPPLEPDQYVQISLSVPLGPANNFFKGPFRTGVVISDADVLPIILKPVGSGLAVGQRYFSRQRTYDPNGKVSNYLIRNLGEVVA